MNMTDNLWIIVSTAFVLLMSIPGLAVFYGGLTRSKSILNTIAMVLSAFCVVGLLWITYGYSLAFGEDVGGVVGSLKWLFLSGVNPSDSAPAAQNLFHYVFIAYQMTFACITVALMAGAFIERIKFSAWLLFSALWFTLVYAPVAHWIWGGGWLSGVGTLDFAGGLVVHETSGVSALVGAILLGRRKEPVMMPASLPLVVVGTGLLWFGWFGFNGGSALSVNSVAVTAIFTTTMASITAGLTWMVLEILTVKRPTTLGMMTGFIAGLATITPASGFVDLWAGVLIGFLGGVVCFGAVVYLKDRFGYDDSLDVFGVHGVGGMLGSLLLGALAKPSVNEAAGLFFGNPSQLMSQLLGVLAVGVYSALITGVIFLILRSSVGVRVSEEEEIEGLDTAVHGEEAYNR
ncbi:ammonium transporter [Hydrogenivirga sp.]